MNTPSIIVSLMTKNNGYQRQQAAEAEKAAARLGVNIEVLFADNDPIQQSQQLLSIIQSSRGPRPDAIVVCPVGTGMKQVAQAAASSGIGWAIINREVDYLEELRSKTKVPMCHVNVDQLAVGRIQSQQMRALLPLGGTVLYLLGPSSNPAVQARWMGMESERASNVQVRSLRGKWTEQSGYDAASAWLRMATSHQIPINLVCSQNDDMAVGARRAFETLTTGEERERLCAIPFTGCDACEGTGREWLRKGTLTASIAMPSTAGVALEILVKALRTGELPAERTVAMPTSVPEMEKLSPVKTRNAAFA